MSDKTIAELFTAEETLAYRFIFELAHDEYLFGGPSLSLFGHMKELQEHYIFSQLCTCFSPGACERMSLPKEHVDTRYQKHQSIKVEAVRERYERYKRHYDPMFRDTGQVERMINTAIYVDKAISREMLLLYFLRAQHKGPEALEEARQRFIEQVPNDRAYEELLYKLKKDRRHFLACMIGSRTRDITFDQRLSLAHEVGFLLGLTGPQTIAEARTSRAWIGWGPGRT